MFEKAGHGMLVDAMHFSDNEDFPTEAVAPASDCIAISYLERAFDV